MATEKAAPVRKRCRVLKTTVRPCWALDKAIEDVYRGGKGVRFHQLRKLSTRRLDPTRAYVSLHSGDFKKKGVVMNFCPFCGTDIGSHMKARNG